MLVERPLSGSSTVRLGSVPDIGSQIELLTRYEYLHVSDVFSAPVLSLSKGAVSCQCVALVKKIHHRIQPAKIHRMRGLPAHYRLGVIRHADAAFGHEFEVVGAIAHADDLFTLDAQQ